MAKNKGLIAAGLTVGIIGISYVIYILLKKHAASLQSNPGTGNMSTGTPGTTVFVPAPKASDVVSSGFPLQNGSSGNNVKLLQQALVRLNPNALPKYGVDGKFGSETQAALMKQTGKSTVANAQELQNIINQASGAGSGTTTGSGLTTSGGLDFLWGIPALNSN